ncbi:MAG: translocation/assembly module TamB domain-containing protein [Cyanophyceae cyanobacterium]
MTNSPQPSTPPENQNQGGIVSRLKSPWAIALGVGAVTLGIVGYAGIRIFVERSLPNIIENQLSQILTRPVDIGDVESFSLTSIRFGESTIPTTPTEDSTASIEAIAVNINYLPLLLRRDLFLDLTLVKPDIYLSQDENGSWLELDLELEDEVQERPFDIYLNILVEEAELVALPYGREEPQTIFINGSGDYAQADEVQAVSYNAEVAIADGQIRVIGETQIDTGETSAEARLQNLDLSELLTLLPTTAVDVTNGQLDADLAVEIPSFAEWTDSLAEGSINIRSFEANVEQLTESVSAEVELQFNGTEVLFEQARATLGEVVAQIDGSIDWQAPQGLDVDLAVSPFDVATVLEAAQVESPVDVAGNLQLDLQLQGAAEAPVLIGNVSSTTPVRVAETTFEQIQTAFTADLSRFVLNSLQATPAAGGAISAQGFIETNFREALEENEEINFNQMPLSFSLDARLPTEAIAAPYYQFPADIQVGTITATGQVRGTIDAPQAVLAWGAPQASAPTVETISGAGEVVLANNQILLRDTQLQTDRGGQVTLSGSGNLETQQWQAVLNASSLRLDPFLAQIPSDQIQITEPVLLNRVDARASGSFDELDPEAIQGAAELALRIGSGTASANARLSEGNLTATANADQVPVSQFFRSLSDPVTLTNAQVNASVPLEELLAFGDNPDLNRLDATFEAQLTAAQGTAIANGQVSNGAIAATANATQISLAQLIPNLTESVTLTSAQARLTGPLEELTDGNPNLNRFDANFAAQLAAAQGTASASGRVNNGTVVATANASGIALDRVVNNLSVPTTLVESQVDVSGPLSQLLALRDNLDLSRFEADLEAQLAVAEGVVNATGQLDNNQWQTNVVASDINTALINDRLNLVELEDRSLLQDLNARLDLAGTLAPFYSPGVDSTVQANTITVEWGDQFLDASGNIVLSNLTTNPDVGVDLEIVARSDLEALPLTEVISQLPTNQQFLPQEVNVTGLANFDGRFQGSNLLSAPTAPGNVELVGDVRLVDFSLNGREFAPVLAGPVTIEPGQELALNLRGEQDVIAATLEPCTRGAECLAPYLPASFELRQGAGTTEPIIALGERIGDRLVAEVQNFPLGILSLSPGTPYGIPGEIGGELSTALDVNLFDLAASGSVQVSDPALGDRVGELITAEFAYADNIAQLVSASLDLGESEYAAAGRLNFDTGAVNASLDADGNVQDILTALNVTSIESATRFFGSPDYAEVEQIPAISVGGTDATLAAQLNLLTRIEQLLQQVAAEREAPGIPTQLDIRGPFTAEVLVAGTLQSPELDFQVQGEDWRWRTQPEYPDLVEPLGLVIEDPQVLSIGQVLLEGSYEDGVATLEPVEVRVEDALLAFAGQLSADPTQESRGDFRVEDLSVDLLRNFVEVPLDIDGDINTQGTVAGTLQNPQVQGEIAFVDGVLNGRPLEQPLAGEYRFADARLNFVTTEESLVEAQASIPYPPAAENDQFEVAVSAGTEAIALVGAFTQGNIEWVEGEGQADLQARGRIDLSQGFSLTDLVATGEASLEDALFELNVGVIRQEPLSLDGQFALENQRLVVESLNGNLAGAELLATGVLPLFTPLNLNEPLTVAVTGDDVDLEGLYEGSIDGQTILTGTARSPVIGGRVRLYDGQAFVPERNQETRTEADANVAALLTEAVEEPTPGTAASNAGGGGFNPLLDDFEVIVGDDFRIEQRPLYRLDLEGALTLNGPATNFPEIRPEGTIFLRRGEISLFNSPGQLENPLQDSGTFNLVRGRENVVVFEPSQGLLNPYLDIQFVSTTTAPDASLIVRDSFENEIRDDLTSGDRGDTIRITLSVDGQASEIIPALANNTTDACVALQKPFPIPKEDGYTPSELNLLEACIANASFDTVSARQLIDSPAVELTSTPARSDSEIIALLGNQFIGLAEQFQNSNEEELLQFGVQQFVVAPLLRDVLFGVQSAVTGVGQSIGLADLRVYPDLEGIYELTQESSLNFTIDYTDTEVRIQYNRRF